MTKTTRIAGVALLLGLAMLATELAVPTLAVPTLASAAATPTKAPLLDINSATQAALKALPGIGDAYSAKIVQNRPYKRKDELVTRNILPQAVYDKIKDLIIAKQP
jgi:competence protein ComEA